MSWLSDYAGVFNGNARLGFRKNSAGSTFLRRRLNLIEGTGVTITVSDDSGNEEVDVTFDATGGVSAGSVGPTELASTGVTPGTYGDATHVGQFTVDADGRLTFAADVLISGSGGSTEFSLLTNGDLVEPELVFADGDVIVVTV